MENIYSFQKERAFFGEENREQLVSSRHRLIGFDPREIWIVGEIERDGLSQAKLGGRSKLTFNSVIDEPVRLARSA